MKDPEFSGGSKKPRALHYHELGADYFDRRSSQQRTTRLVRQLEQLGHKVNLEPLAA